MGMTHGRTHRWLGLAVVVVLSGCPRPPSIEEIGEQAAQDTASLLEEAWDAAAASTKNSAQLAGMVKAWNLTVADLQGSAVTQPQFPERTRDAQSAVFDPIKEVLTKRIFVKENIEASDGTAVTFLMNGPRACTEPNGTVRSPTCAKTIDDLQYRVKVSGDPGSRLSFDILLGAGKAPVATLVLEKGKAIEGTIRFTEYQRAIKAYDPATAALLVGTTVFEEMEGEYVIRLKKVGALEFVLSYNITKNINLAYRGTDGLLRSASLSAASPGTAVPNYGAILVDGNRGQHVLQLKLDALKLSLPAKDVLGSGEDATPLDIKANGMIVNLSTEVAMPQLLSGSIVLQPVRATYGGEEVVDIRTTGLLFEVSTGTDGRLNLSLQDVDATGRFHLARIPNWSGDSQYWGNEDWRLQLTDSPLIKAGIDDAAQAFALKLVNGHFKVDAAVAQQSFEVSAGQCLVGGLQNEPGPLHGVGPGPCR